MTFSVTKPWASDRWARLAAIGSRPAGGFCGNGGEAATQWTFLWRRHVLSAAGAPDRSMRAICCTARAAQFGRGRLGKQLRLRTPLHSYLGDRTIIDPRKMRIRKALAERLFDAACRVSSVPRIDSRLSTARRFLEFSADDCLLTREPSASLDAKTGPDE